MQKTVEVTEEVYIDKTVDVSMVPQMQAPMIQKVLKTVEAPEMQYTDETIDVPVDCTTPSPHHSNSTGNSGSATGSIPSTECQTSLLRRDWSKCPRPCLKSGSRNESMNNLWTFQFLRLPRKSLRCSMCLFTQDRVQQRNVEQIAETPAASLDEEIMKIPKTQTQEKNICCLTEDQSELIIEKSDVPVPHVMKKTIEVVKLIPQEQAQNHTVRQITDVPVPRMEENTEVEMLKVSFKLDGGSAAQAPEWEEPQRLRAEEFLAIRDVNKLPDDSGSLELFKQTSCLIDIGRAQDEDTSLATDTKSHGSAIAEPTAAAQHRNNNHRKQQQQAGQVEEKGKEEKGRKGEGERGQ